jgi:hypothetical protein
MKPAIVERTLEPEYVEAWAQFKIIQDATNKLAELARVEFSNSEQKMYPHAAGRLSELPRLFMDKASHVLASGRPDAPCFFANHLLWAVTDVVTRFEDAIRSRPRQFLNAARQQLYLPTLRSVRDNGKSFRQLAEQVELGGDYGLKATGAIDFNSVPNLTVAEILRLIRLSKILATAYGMKYLDPTMQEVAQKKFPRLTRKKSSLAFWWKHGIHPFLKIRDLDANDVPKTPEKYLHLADASLKQKWWKAKPELRAKNLFETACKKALKNLAPPVTNKIKIRS